MLKKYIMGAGAVAIIVAGLIVGCDRTEDIQTIAKTDSEIVSRETETTYQKLYKDIETTTQETSTEAETTEEIIVETYSEESPEYSPEQFMSDGIIYYNGWTFTYYSENILPGDGLDIPGRWSDGNFVRDCDGYICCASSDLDYGTVLDSPFGEAKVYDCGCDSGVIDLYVSW